MKITYTCDHCGESFDSVQSLAGHSNTHKDKNSKVEVSCKVCGKVFDEVYPSVKDKYSYCSSECRKKHFNNNSEKFNLFEEGHEGYDTSPWQNKELSEEHKKSISDGLQGLKRSEEYVKQNLAGENHWNWQGGKSYEEYASTFNPMLKRKIRKNNCFRCKNCGKPQHDNIDECGKKLEVHHLDEDKDNNSEDNLIPLCTECHTRHHNSSGFKLPKSF